MNKFWMIFASLIFASVLTAQERLVDFEEFTLDNGLHVILHEDNSTPIVAVTVLYHVGSKNERPDRTGFAHFFEHLLFEGTKNIPRGEYDQYVERNGGTLNANTSNDRTFYYEIFSSNNLELGLWLESERMLHAKVDQIGIDTQRDVIKEERKQTTDNRPYGTLFEESFKRLFTKHPYNWSVIGDMDHLDASVEQDFIDFYQTFYLPKNATLSIAGDINVEEAKELIETYFGSIPKGQAINLYRDFIRMDDDSFEEKHGVSRSIFNEDDFFQTTSKQGLAVIKKYENMKVEIPRPNIVEPPLSGVIHDTIFDNVQLPGVFISYHSPAQNTKDAYALQMINYILSGGASSRMNKNIVEKKELAVSAFSFNFPLEDPGLMMAAAIATLEADPDEVLAAIDEEIERIKTELVSEEEFQTVKNQLENEFYSSNSSMAGLAGSLANSHVYYGDANKINTRLENFASLTKEDLMKVANKYFTQDKRVILYFLPEEDL